MPRYPDYLQIGKVRRELTRDWRNNGMPGDYAAWLIARLGRPMVRILIKARARYERQQPARIRARQLRRAYRAKRRHW